MSTSSMSNPTLAEYLESRATSLGGAAAAGKVTMDYAGSYEEWKDRVIAALITRYKNGLGGAGGYDQGDIGKPAAEDFGTPDKVLSWQTIQYWERYVEKYAHLDPWIIEQFGNPPERHATFIDDPNSPASLQGTWKDRAAFDAEQRALDRQKDIDVARIAADAQISSTKMRVDADLAIAAMEDATRRWIAEGDWGVQKYIAELEQRGAMDRLLLELQSRDQDRAQRAIEERNRHHEQMVSLALEIAKYDAELAAEPRNWLKYAAWLRSRDIVVNGLTLTMAADMVPDDQMSPEMVMTYTGSSLGSFQTMMETGSGGNQSNQYNWNNFQFEMNDFGGGNQSQQFGDQSQTWYQNTNLQPGPNTMNQMVLPPSAEQLGQMTDYTALAQNLLGMNPLQASADEASPQNLQTISNTLTTSQVQGGRVPSFGNYTGPTTNALGVTVTEPTGHKVDYRNFMRLLPSQQQMKLGQIASLGRYEPDFIEEMERSRPKGFASGVPSFG